MDYHTTDADLLYRKLSDAMNFVHDAESFMIMYFSIKAYEQEYPSYYKTHYLKYKLKDRLDRSERLDVSFN